MVAHPKLRTSFDTQKLIDEVARQRAIPMTDAGYAVYKTAREWGGSISPKMAEAIAEKVLMTAGQSIDPEAPKQSLNERNFGRPVRTDLPHVTKL